MAGSDHHLIRIRSLVAEVDRAVGLIDGDVPGGVAAEGRENGWAIREAAVIRAVDVELRRRDETRELAVGEVDRVAAVELHPVAVVDRNRDVGVGVAVV